MKGYGVSSAFLKSSFKILSENIGRANGSRQRSAEACIDREHLVGSLEREQTLEDALSLGEANPAADISLTPFSPYRRM